MYVVSAWGSHLSTAAVEWTSISYDAVTDVTTGSFTVPKTADMVPEAHVVATYEADDGSLVLGSTVLQLDSPDDLALLQSAAVTVEVGPEVPPSTPRYASRLTTCPSPSRPCLPRVPPALPFSSSVPSWSLCYCVDSLRCLAELSMHSSLIVRRLSGPDKPHWPFRDPIYYKPGENVAINVKAQGAKVVFYGAIDRSVTFLSDQETRVTPSRLKKELLRRASSGSSGRASGRLAGGGGHDKEGDILCHAPIVLLEAGLLLGAREGHPDACPPIEPPTRPSCYTRYPMVDYYDYMDFGAIPEMAGEVDEDMALDGGAAVRTRRHCLRCPQRYGTDAGWGGLRAALQLVSDS